MATPVDTWIAQCSDAWPIAAPRAIDVVRPALTHAAEDAKPTALNGATVGDATWSTLARWTVALDRQLRTAASAPEALDAVALIARILRNLCAGQPAHQAAFRSETLPTPPPPPPPPRVGRPR